MLRVLLFAAASCVSGFNSGVTTTTRVTWFGAGSCRKNACAKGIQHFRKEKGKLPTKKEEVPECSEANENTFNTLLLKKLLDECRGFGDDVERSCNAVYKGGDNIKEKNCQIRAILDEAESFRKTFNENRDEAESFRKTFNENRCNQYTGNESECANAGCVYRSDDNECIPDEDDDDEDDNDEDDKPKIEEYDDSQKAPLYRISYTTRYTGSKTSSPANVKLVGEPADWNRLLRYVTVLLIDFFGDNEVWKGNGDWVFEVSKQVNAQRFGIQSQKLGTISKAKWMEEFANLDGVRSQKLGTFLFPGSHDSGCTDKDFSYEGKLSDLLRRSAVTQRLGFKEQLERGARFFDVRFGNSSKGIRIVHPAPISRFNTYYMGLDPVVQDFNDFCSANRGEVLMLKLKLENKQQWNAVRNSLVFKLENIIRHENTETLGDLSYDQVMNRRTTDNQCAVFLLADKNVGNTDSLTWPIKPQFVGGGVNTSDSVKAMEGLLEKTRKYAKKHKKVETEAMDLNLDYSKMLNADAAKSVKKKKQQKERSGLRIKDIEENWKANAGRAP